jgi:hypothetical protein
MDQPGAVEGATGVVAFPGVDAVATVAAVAAGAVFAEVPIGVSVRVRRQK